MPGKTSQAAGKKGHDASRDRLTSSNARQAYFNFFVAPFSLASFPPYKTTSCENKLWSGKQNIVIPFVFDFFFFNSDSGSKKISIWPEWSDADLAMEKWELAGGGTGGKGQKKSIHPAIVCSS